MKNIWVSLSGQVAQQRKVETIANNVANANTVGFKKDQLVFKEHLTALTRNSDDIDVPRNEFSPSDFYHTQGAENAFVAIDGSFTIHDQGQLVPTQNQLDLAIKGNGFFEVLTPNGVRFTRKGNFSLNKDGELVTDQGFRVLSNLNVSDEVLRNPASVEALPNAEERIIKLPLNTPITISENGIIENKNGTIGQISIIEFSDLHALKKEGNSLFISPDENNIRRTEVTSTLNQGFLEGSNVNAVEEMAELIKAHRHFESIQKAINAYDSISGKAANEIGKF